MNLLIKNSLVVNPSTDTEEVLDILVINGIIEKLQKHMDEDLIKEDYPDLQVIDATGLTAFPGLCDIHVHFRDPGWPAKETIESGAAAALAGGVTTVVNMANTSPVVDNVETLSYIVGKAKDLPIELLQNSAITVGLKGQEVVDGTAQLAAGACGFSDDGIPIIDVAVMKKAMEEAKSHEKILSLHEELPSLFFSQGVNFGPAAEAMGVGGAPSISESALIERDILLQQQFGGHLHFQHLSAARSVKLIREAKARGQQVTCEVTSQHLTLTEQVVIEQGTNGRINPPIRTEADRQALIAGIVDGTIDCIVTDHAPHTAEEKAKAFESAPSGMIGLETSLSVAFDTLVRGEYISRLRLAELMSVTPAALYGRKKEIAEGAPADICLFDENCQYVYDKTVSKSTNSPFLGKTLRGKVRYTVTKNQIHRF